MDSSSVAAAPPPRVAELARAAVEYVKRAIGLELTYDSDTLPLLDHYLRTVPDDQPSTVELVATTSGAYFGEVVRRTLGGRWDTSAEDITDWRIVLPTGLNFSPAGFAAAAIVRADLDDLDTTMDAPPRMRPFVEQTLARMGDVTEDDYYSLCGRLDTLEHVHEVLVAVAAKLIGKERGELPDDDDVDEIEPEGAATDEVADDDDGSPPPGQMN
ncbi:MAG TPA: hypothetical protein VM261_26550 [Kofleriaceae bacterium]|nr:hypothetical protein [Kofleriaceae bacterium]